MKTLIARPIFWALAVIGWFLYQLPFAVKKTFAVVLAALFYDVLGFRKRIVLHNLALVFAREQNESMGEFRARCEQLARKNYVHYMLCFLEIFERFHWRDSDLNRKFRVVGQAHIDRHLKAKDGFFFLTAHIGNWELISRVVVIMKFKLAVITKYLRNPVANQVWVLSRKRYGLELLDEQGSGLKIMRAIRNRRAVGFILDQHIGPPHGIAAVFMGVEAMCPRGLAVLSSRLDCPVVPTYLLREPDGMFTFYVEGDIDFSALRTSPALWDGKQLTELGLRAHVEICNKNMEAFVRRYPEQYLWLHKRFKNRLDYRSRLPWEL